MFSKSYLIPLIIALLLHLFSMLAFAQDQNTDFISQLEEQLFSTTYVSQSLSERLSRLEETIFGQSSPQESDKIRISRLQALLSPETKPVTTTDNTQSSTSDSKYTDTSSTNQQDLSEKEPNNSTGPIYYNDQEVEDYPAVSLLESKVFNKTYKNEDVSKRLERLEINIFNQAKPELPLSERLDNLKMAVTGSLNNPIEPNVHYDNSISQGSTAETYYSDRNLNPQQYYQSPEMNTFQQDPSLPNNSMNQYTPIEPGYDPSQFSVDNIRETTTKLEEQILGQSFPNEQLNNRLDRLEMQVFSKTATGYTPESRLERLVAVTAAKNTSDPGDLKQIKRLRKIQTGLTIGGLLFSILQGFLF